MSSLSLERGKIKAPRGKHLNARSWLTEAPLRLLMNNLDATVAENPDELVVYGGKGKAARNWECFYAIVDVLLNLKEDETLLVQSGKPVGVFQTQLNSPRVLIANSNIVPHWSSWDYFNELDKKGLMMYGQMTAGSWIYIGSQGIIQGTYETFRQVAQKYFAGSLAGKWILTAGLGGMGGAQPLAAKIAGASSLVVECDPEHIQRRIKSGYLDIEAKTLAEALNIIQQHTAKNNPISVGLLANAAEIFPQISSGNYLPDIVTDQTSAHDPLNGYLPIGWTLEEAKKRRREEPQTVIEMAKRSMAIQVKAMLDLQKRGIPTFDYGNNIRYMAYTAGVSDAFEIPGFIKEFIRPLFCRGIGPFRWVALSGDPEDIYKTDAKIKELFPDNKDLHLWLDAAKSQIKFQGLPARICWLGLGERAKAGLAFNEMVATGELSAPIVIGRDHLDGGSVASPYRETEGMLDGSDAVADWPILNALLNCASGATWVSVHEGGGVGISFSKHAGMVIVADGSAAAAERLQRVLTNDPVSGVMRHVDAGYDLAKQCASENGLYIPMLKNVNKK